MISIKVMPKSKEPLICVVPSEEGPLTTNICADVVPQSDGHGCGLCHKENELAACNLLGSLSSILYYFSDLISYEEVAVEMMRGKYEIRYHESAQQVCFSVCMYAMFYSSCEFFSRLRFVLKYYHASFEPDSYMHMVLTTSLIRRRIDFDAVHERVDLFREVESFNKEVTLRLRHVLSEARFFKGKDAAVNAINIAFNLNTLATEGLKEFYEEFFQNIKRMSRVL